MESNEKTKKKPKWLLWLLLVFIPPVGIIYMWITEKEMKNKLKTILSIVFALWFIICLCVGPQLQETPAQTNQPIANEDSKDQNDEEPEETVPEKTPEEQLAEELKTDATLVNNIYSACESVGMAKENVDIVAAANDGTACLATVNYEGYEFSVTGSADNNITGIVSGDIVFYENGSVVQNVNDRIVTTEQQVVLMNQAEEDVKENLKAPSTAEFPGHIMDADDWTIIKDGDTFTVSAWVDAQNSFGAQVRNTFIVTYTWSGDSSSAPILENITIE